MPEPTTTGTAGIAWLVIKLASAVAGLFGSLAMATFWMPPRMRAYGRVGGFCITAAIGSLSALFGHAVVMRWASMDVADMDMVMAVSAAIGLSSFACLNWVANSMAARENNDALQVLKEARGQAQHRADESEDEGSSNHQPPRGTP